MALVQWCSCFLFFTCTLHHFLIHYSNASPILYPGTSSGLVMAPWSCYLQSALLMNRILPSFGGPSDTQSVLHSSGALDFKQTR